MNARIGTVRLALATAAALLAWLCVGRHAASPLWLLVPAICFAAAVLYHQRVRTLRALAQRAAQFYRAGLERLRGQRREARGTGGERFVQEHHLYGADLDLFGKQSLFECLCTARTPMGEAMLAQWLLTPADLATIRARQACVAEMRGRLELREDLEVLGEPAHISLQPHAIVAWARAPGELPGGLGMVALLLVAAAAASAAAWAIWGFEFPFFGVLAIEATLHHAYRRRVQRAVSGVEHAYEDLKLLSVILRRIEAEPFDAPPLRALKQKLSSHSLAASKTLANLATIVNFVEARRNPFLAPLMVPLMYAIQTALAAERWRRVHGPILASWLSVIGEIEALQSIAAYSFERPDDPFPEFLDGPATFIAVQLGHPLLAAATRVRNDVDISAETRVLLVSGSNMSGKSTLLRSVGMNAVLAMAGGPVCAAHLRLTPLQVGASIRVNDSLYEGSSRFYAEITRLRQLFEPSPLPLLFLLDELLQGTNSTDRRVGAQGVLRALLARGAIGLVSTHDLALADATDLSPGALENVHFQDELVDGRLRFDFKLRDGIVTRSNGIELMRAIGLEV